MPTAAIIVAHPDDEILWCGGFLLTHRAWDWSIATLCRGSDPDRAPRFHRVMSYLKAHGTMGDLDDSPEQPPLSNDALCSTILGSLPEQAYDLVLTHGPRGEYTHHRRHKECSLAVTTLWATGKIRARAMKLFAYHDNHGATNPQVCADADESYELSSATVFEKRNILTKFYGFNEESWEAKAMPEQEGFYCSDEPSRFSALHTREYASGDQ
jgi:hypothetical protein